MKKNYLLTLLLALCTSLQCWAEFNPTPGKMYALKEVTSGLYLDIQTLGIVDGTRNTNNISLNANPRIIYFENGSTSGTWKLKNINGKYVYHVTPNNDGHWNPEIKDTPSDWTITESNGKITIARSDKKYINVDSKVEGKPLYCDKDTGMEFSLIDFPGKDITGDGKQATISIQDINGLTTVPTGTGWTISMNVENPNGASYNDWGTSIFAIGSNAFPEKQGYKGIQLYLQSSTNGGKLDAVFDGGDNLIDNVTHTGNFSTIVTYNGANRLQIKTKNASSNEAINDYKVNTTLAEFSQLSYGLPTGINVKNLTLETLNNCVDYPTPATVDNGKYTFTSNKILYAGTCNKIRFTLTESAAFYENKKNRMSFDSFELFDADGKKVDLKDTYFKGNYNKSYANLLDGVNAGNNGAGCCCGAWNSADEGHDYFELTLPNSIDLGGAFSFSFVTENTTMNAKAFNIMMSYVAPKDYTFQISGNGENEVVVTHNEESLTAGATINIAEFDANAVTATEIPGYTWKVVVNEDDATVTLVYTSVEIIDNPAAVVALAKRIGGEGAADKFKFVLDPSLNSKQEVFVLDAEDNKILIKGTTISAITTGLGWYLNHIAKINIAWNSLNEKTVSGAAYADLSNLPLPAMTEMHASDAKYRYYLNTCTFGYSMTSWTWTRWQQEIDWMALHGINAPLNLVGLEVVTRNFLKELGVSETDIDKYIAGPGFMAWFAMNNLEGWGSTINATDVAMNGNPDWWYDRQEELCKKMLQRMRELGMQPVIPGFSGQVPNCIVNYTIDGFSSSHVINNGSWAGGYTRPDILNPSTTSYATFAPIYYKHLHAVMGVSELYSMDPFHEGNLPSGVTNENCYPNIMKHLDGYHDAVDNGVKSNYNVSSKAKWIIQYWQGVPQDGAFSAMSSYGDRFIGLDLFADNIYAGNAAKWRDTGDACYFKGRPYIYCMLHNFGGRSGMHGRLETTMDGYFQALAKNNNCQGIGATPEGTETNPILYDMLFELPWMDVNNRPSADEWLEDYAYSRYGIQNSTALSALQNLKKSVWNCQRNQQGTSEAIILGRPRWTFGDAQRNDGTSLEGRSVSSWSVSSIYWDTQDVLLAADDLYSIKDLITTEDGRANFDYDFIEVVRQAMVDQASVLLPLIKAARNNGDTAEYERLYKMFLQLMLDLDEMLSYDENFKLERWTSLARNIANEAAGTNANDRNWLEWNARTQVTVWSNGNNGLNDYSNRCWAGLIKDFHYPRWKYFFENNGGVKDGNWFTSEKAWTVNFTDYDYSTVTIPGGKTATEKAAETFGNYFGRVRGATKNYIFPMGITTNATKCDVTPTVNRGQTVELPLIIGKSVTISSVWIDLNADGNAGNGETLTANGNNVTIPAEAKIGKTTAQVVYSDGTDITFNLALVEEISEERTVTAVAGANGSVAIEGTNELSITNAEAVKMTATANTGYNFEKWTDAQGNTVSNDNPYIYYGKGAATFTANFIQNKWGVVACGADVDGEGTVKDEAAVMADVKNNNQYIHNLTLSYYNREAETIFEPTTAPTSIFTTIPQIVNVPQGASFTVEYDKGISNQFQHCYFRAYIDLNADGDFDDEGELLKEVGSKGAQNTAVCSNSINVLLPYTMPLGITHMRLRFDSAWNIGDGAKAKSVRPVYDLVINVTEGSDKAAHITVASNNDAWGTAKVWTEETPGWTASNEWNVSTGIYAKIKAVKASDDVEFLGWYDQYGRLLTNELEYSMLAREDATYTARFRKALDIDGWEFEYRTEPGEVVTNKLANGVKPEAGKTYYIYAPTRPTNNGEYVNRYLYNNSGTLTLSTTESTAASYLWVCGIEDGKYTFQNVADPAKYLKHKGLANAPYGFELGTGTTYYEGITLQSVPGDGETRNLFFVINDNGSGFNHSTRAHNQSTEDYTTDFVFTEVSTPNVVILTSVRKSGDHDLDIPETVEILGEQCKVVGFDNNLFNNNKDLWSISLPSTIETLSNNVLFRTSVKGENTPTSSGDNNPDNKVQVIDLGFTLKKSEAWTIRATYKSDGVSTFNQWGSPLLYPNGNGTGTELFFLSNVNGWSSCWHVRSPFSGLGNDYFKDLTNAKIATFTALLENKGTGKAVITVTNSEGQSKTSSDVTFSYDNISAFSAKLPKGLDITKFEVLQGAEPDPFEGCTNLLDITIANGGCNGGYTVDGREFKNASGVVLHTLADAEKEDAIRTLGALIDNTKTLMDIIATSIDPVGKATEIVMQSTSSTTDYYIWCSNPHDSGNDAAGGVAALLDENDDSYLHTDYTNVSASNDFLQVELGDGNELYQFKIAGKHRKAAGSDIPKNIEIQGSTDKNTWETIETVDNITQNAGAAWESEVITATKKYPYLRFVVTTGTNRIYFHMAKFDLIKLTSTVEVAPKYKNLAGITNDEAAAAYDGLVNALYVYNNGGTADELQAAYNVLKPLYDALKAKKDNMVELASGVYAINYKNGDSKNGDSDAAVFVGYNDDKDNSNHIGYKLIATGTYSANAEADKLFSIVYSDNGYTLSAQGKYLKQPTLNAWNHIMFSDNKDEAGTYIFERNADLADVFKIRSSGSGINYINDYDNLVFGNDKVNKENLSTFSFTPVTKYTFEVSKVGMATLCLPFNVVLPADMVAYGLAESRITKSGDVAYAYMDVIAEGGEVLKAGTPVIIKAAQGSYTLAITMDDTGAKGALEGSLLKGNFISQTLTQGQDGEAQKFIFANRTQTQGVGFYIMDAEGTIGANKCWMEWNMGSANVRSLTIRFGDGDATDIEEVEMEPARPMQQGIYNLAGQRLEAPQKGVNIINGKKVVIK